MQTQHIETTPANGRDKPTTDLEAVLFAYKKKWGVAYRYRLKQAVRGTLITGTIGAGKTSGFGDFLATLFLKHGWGGLVLCGKNDEADEWVERAKRAGRDENDIVRFRADGDFLFNPLMYEQLRKDDGGNNTDTMTRLLTSAARLSNRLAGGSSGGSKDPYWDMALERLTKASLDVIKYSESEMNVATMVSLIVNVPQTKNLLAVYKDCLEKLMKARSDRMGDNRVTKIPMQSFDKIIQGSRRTFDQYRKNHPQENEEQITQRIKDSASKADFVLAPEGWEKNPLITALLRAEQREDMTSVERAQFEVARQYFLNDLPNQSERMRSSILEMFYAYYGAFRAGSMADIFSKGISQQIDPERSLEGKIILLDFPYHTYGALGSFVQTLYKRTWQQAMQRRNTDENARPVFLWIDEYQLFADPDDQEFCTTARSSRVAPVFLTQNISNLYAAIGNQNRVVSMLGNLVTKVFHQNNDFETNEFAVRTIAERRQKVRKTDIRERTAQVFENVTEQQVTPYEFTQLRTGGKSEDGKSDYMVEAIMTGDTYYSKPRTPGGEPVKENFMKIAVAQHFKSKIEKT